MIRAISLRDVDECASVIRVSFATVAEAFGITAANAPRFTGFATTPERLTHQLLRERRPMYACCADGRIVGCYSLRLQEGSACERNNLCVLPAYRHQRMGEKLLAHAQETAKALPCSKMTLGIVEENRTLRTWYENHGFVHIGTEKFDFFPFTCGYIENLL